MRTTSNYGFDSFKGFFIVGLFIAFSCQPSRFTSQSNLEKNANYLEQQGYLHWEKRTTPKDARMARYFLSQAYSLKPKNLELAIAVSRAYYFEAQYIEPDPAAKDSLFLLGAEIAKQALLNSPRVVTALQDVPRDSNAIIQKAIEVADEQLVPALYWWAANIGRYLVTKAVMTRMQHREQLEMIMHRVLALNPNYYYGGPYRFFGTLYARLPGVALSQSKSYFDQAITAYPDYLATRVLMAQYYHTKAGNREQFHAELEKVIAADPTLIPEVMPENLYEQEHAKKLLEQEASLFE
ncbi:MAG: hypothetical protein GXO92_06465 [FCB group bacterium]|nr:hypothetical protein [FCB group bacterium]